MLPKDLSYLTVLTSEEDLWCGCQTESKQTNVTLNYLRTPAAFGFKEMMSDNLPITTGVSEV